MGTRKVLNVVSAVAFLLITSSCASMRANMLLLKETTVEDKAELMFRDGLAKYQTLILKEQKLDEIPAVRSRFRDALKLNPEHAGAKKYLADLEAFKTKQYALNLATANDLSKKEKRSADQDYAYVVAVQKLKQLDSSAPETKTYSQSTSEIRSTVIKTRSEELAALQKAIDAETNRAEKLKKLNNARRLADNILFIDPINPSVGMARDGIEKKITDLTAEQAASQTQVKAPAAKAPAKAVPKKAAYDYDADILEIVGSIDVQIKAQKLAEAMDIVRTYEPRMKDKANVDRIAAKKAEIQKTAAAIYQNGINAYNEEDYETARTAFLKVVQYDAGYEQAQAYLDRSETKLRALSGR